MERGSLVKDLVRVCVAVALGTCATLCIAAIAETGPPPVRSAAAAPHDIGMIFGPVGPLAGPLAGPLMGPGMSPLMEMPAQVYIF
ncbi:MAG TPA: hypothetical protein VD997_02185 [Phycisphaerales bacterium]|nr:hypothetical protein [Phycisphaerales bacterium]